MIFGFIITLPMLAIGGLTMLALLFFQLSTGLKWIKLLPKNRLVIHKTTGITLVVFALMHGSMGLILATGLTIG